MKDILCLLLAGGDSSRFWPLGDKHFLPFLGRPLIYHSLGQLYRWGFRDFIIIANIDNKKSFDNVREIYPDINLKVLIQSCGTGMAGAVWTARDLISDKKILVIGPSDIFENILLSQLKQIMTKDDPDGILTGISMGAYFPGGYLKIENERITGIIEKPDPDKLPSNIVTFVFDFFKKGKYLIQAIKKIGLEKNDCFEQAINLMVKRGQIFRLLRYKGFIGFLKYPWHTLKISLYFLEKTKEKHGQNISIASSATISGKVYIDDDVRVLENAKIIGPSYIGKGSIIGNNTLVREAMIGDSCVIGYGTEVVRSYIGDNCWFHSNYIGDSVISNNVGMGAGTILANFRLDEKMIETNVGDNIIETGRVKFGAIIGTNVRIGVNTSIMPGVKIGRNCLIGAGIVLDKDLPDGKYCVPGKKSYRIKTNKIIIPQKLRNEQRNKLKLS